MDIAGAGRIKPNSTDLSSLQMATLRRIVAALRPYRRRATLVVACIVAGAVLNLAPPLLVKRIVDVALPARRFGLLMMLCVGMILGPLLAGTLQVGQRYLLGDGGRGSDARFPGGALPAPAAATTPILHRRPAGELISHALNDVQGIGSTISGTLVRMVESAVIFCSSAILVLALDWRLGLVALCLLPLFIIPTRRVGRRRKAIKRLTQRALAELTGILTETLSVSGALLLKVFGGEAREAERVAEKGRQLRELSIRQTLLGRWFQMVLGLFESAGPALVFAVGGWLIMHDHLKLGTIVAFVTILKRLYGSLSQLAGVHVDVVTSYAYFERVFELLDVVPEIVDRRGALPLARPRGEIVFRGVTFAHRRAACLEDIDLVVASGQTVGIVGPSGAGKSTLAALVPRLHDPSAGQVLIDGYDLRDLQLDSLRSHIAVVTQETFLLHATIEENLRYGRASASFAEISAAARAARIHDVIATLPDAYQTVVGERGQRFSGGERQRMAIARAILKDPRILILDEATSALDAQNEALVQEALRPLMQGRTTLVIAHRLSTICDADLIVVLNGGRIVERGRHQELLARGGLYAGLWMQQLGPQTPLKVPPAVRGRRDSPAPARPASRRHRNRRLTARGPGSLIRSIVAPSSAARPCGSTCDPAVDRLATQVLGEAPPYHLR